MTKQEHMIKFISILLTYAKNKPTTSLSNAWSTLKITSKTCYHKVIVVAIHEIEQQHTIYTRTNEKLFFFTMPSLFSRECRSGFGHIARL